jgi:integral membrane protein (TIGR01906 family)
MNRLLEWLAMAVLAVVLPLAVISTVVLGLVHDAGFYHDGQVRYEVVQTTGLSQETHDRIDRAIIQFFEGTQTLPDALKADQAPPDVYSQKEILHMNDVRDVIRAFGSVRTVTLAACAIALLLVIGRWNRGGRRFLSRTLITSAIVTVVLGAIVGAITYVAFDALFLVFHEVTFHNDFWELDPRTDHLIQMFPFGFWYDAMLTVATRVVLVTIFLGVVGVFLNRVVGSRGGQREASGIRTAR